MSEPEIVAGVVAGAGVIGWVAKVFHGKIGSNGSGGRSYLEGKDIGAILTKLETIAHNTEPNRELAELSRKVLTQTSEIATGVEMLVEDMHNRRRL